MPALALVGLQWGDEGKGKIIDILAAQADLVVRFQGGNNAGHTIKYENKKFVLHQIPSGIFHPQCKVLLGNGMVVDLISLAEEIEQLKQNKINLQKRIFISNTAHLIHPIHKIRDQISEFKLGKNAIGTTGKGISPAYSDKVNRKGIRLGDLADTENFKNIFYQKIEPLYPELEPYCKKANITLPNLNEVCEELLQVYQKLEEMFCDSLELIHKFKNEGKKILLEGAQGSLLDVDHGSYPFVTSSNTSAGMASIGSGLGPTDIKKVFGIFKAYTTRVGSGPFPTELNNQEGEYLQKHGEEFGATTGRIRRCGWLDLCLLKRSINLNGVSQLGIMKLDVLDKIDKIKVCISYKTKEGKIINNPPSINKDWDKLEPQYESFAGWQSSIVEAKTMNDLPRNCQNYLNFLQKELNLPIVLISTSPKRENCIITKNIF